MTQPAPRRFSLLDDENEPPARGPWWIAAGLVAAGVVALAVLLLVHHGGGSSSLQLRQQPQAKLPAGTRPLPGALPPEVTTVGVVAQVDPTTVAISRAGALRVYDQIPNHITRGGRRVFASVARLAVIQGDAVDTKNYWVVTVWAHPYVGTKIWQVEDALVDAETGRAGYNVVYWPPPDQRPRGV